MRVIYKYQDSEIDEESSMDSAWLGWREARNAYSILVGKLGKWSHRGPRIVEF
jgi:hypothetical protein